MTSHGSKHALRTIALVAATLMLLLGVTVATSLFDLGDASLPIALLIASVKVLIVLVWFMELRRSPALLRLVAGAGVLFLLMLLFGTLADVVTRPTPDGSFVQEGGTGLLDAGASSDAGDRSEPTSRY